MAAAWRNLRNDASSDGLEYKSAAGWPADDQNAFLLFDLTGYLCRELPLAGVIWRASSAPPKVPIIQPAVAEIT